MADTENPKVEIHPSLKHLESESEKLESVVRFTGYIGPSAQRGRVRLYLLLNDLSQYIEFEDHAIVRVADAPESATPNKGLFVWIKAGSPVRMVLEQTTDARQVAGFIASNRRASAVWRRWQHASASRPGPRWFRRRGRE
jgi:hypothetical protein